ncbi:thiamine-phosphate kinase [Methylocystis heyeri]|uniref:Thiamine-monophosphate kinase n=1 Tax=Methylocystis heyeri TaxID=391905 RepID=A0A6B8KG53_9HYPH|nr:thiamine-phosphate kinase [Methylocystis heyeri]QGM45410.1 thiamine-phosphate kinase [Methylocystis heyeri]
MDRRYTEDELIAKLFAPLAGPAALGLMDDAALLPPCVNPMVATVDALVAGVHFFPEDPADSIAKKALRANLSDLAAKGAEPIGFLLALALPPDWTNQWLEAFAAGLAEDCKAFGCPLLGGDTVATPGPLTLSITALGEAAQGSFVGRSGARPGDALYVSGTIGDAALGLRLRRDAALRAGLSPKARDYLLERYLLPRPRLALAPLLRTSASAAMDVSDGLVGDLAKLARASRVAARVTTRDIPLSEAAREAIAIDPTLFELALTGGDDYEILFCARGNASEIERLASAASAPCVMIGEIIAGDGETIFLDAQENIMKFNRLSFSHF